MRYRNRLFVLLLVVLSLTLTMTAQAQIVAPTPSDVNPNANISWPPPVYVLRGEFTVRGSANLSNMVSYFLESRPLEADLNPADDTLPWLPVTAAEQSAIQDDVLGVWDTTLVDDGLYELRLTLNLSNNQQEFFRVAPLRIENNPPPFVITPTIPAVQGTATPLPPQVTATPTFDPSPRATVTLNAPVNVRLGDSVVYAAFAALQPGETVSVVGRSSLGSGWLQVQLSSGQRGWVSPSVVSVSGDLSGVPFVEPPPPPTPTPIPVTPTFTPVPATTNLVAGNFRFDPNTPTCSQTFNVYLDVANFGTTANPSGLISIQDFRVSDGALQGNTTGAIPIIQPGQTVSVGPIPLTISTFYNEQHRLVINLDPGNFIPETSENDNIINALYTLAKGTCP
ncbi:MAG TPA: SH3 domain-containing protein [Phototrophicaceae bacterium]|nr:SH3 domain-containing protein [Phototrophicaceae bacterium]